MNLLSFISRCNEFETLGDLGDEKTMKHGTNTEIHSRSWEYIGETCEKQGWITSLGKINGSIAKRGRCGKTCEHIFNN
jgi:hypothetical protein